MKKLITSIIISLSLTVSLAAQSLLSDATDPSTLFSEIDDSKKTAEELMAEARLLYFDQRYLDARTKLLKVLEKDPKNYSAMMFMAEYYLSQVGHFRLALKFIKQAQNLFEEKNGLPPYEEDLARNEHAMLLSLLSEIRLNLDDYEAALKILDQYGALYFQNWYPASRSWVLMKLGRLDEAIQVAKLGMLSGAEPGRTLNVLGILLSMTHQRKESIDVFNQAILYENARGESGQPATPLNNVGEVYRETFEEDKAEGSFLKALRMPDGCEHVLPSLNLQVLYLEQLKLKQAKAAIDNFEECVKRFPLKNGEEHRALVQLARGRIALQSGQIDSAVSLLESAIARRQWFGKIGTSEDDLFAGASVSLAQALLAQNSWLKTTIDANWVESVKNFSRRITNRLRSKWLKRRALQVLGEDLQHFEDLYIRNTDSMLEYYSLGDLFQNVPRSLFKRKVLNEVASDERKGASLYYQGYIAQNMIKNGSLKEGFELLEKTIELTREKEDAALRQHLETLKLALLDTNSEQYLNLATKVYSKNRSTIRNAGLLLPVSVGPSLSPDLLESSAFIFNSDSSFLLDWSNQEMKFSSSFDGTSFIQSGPNNYETLNKLAQKVFRSEVN